VRNSPPHDLLEAVEPGPVPETVDEVLLAPIAEEIKEPIDLRLLLAAGHDCLVAPFSALPHLAIDLLSPQQR